LLILILIMYKVLIEFNGHEVGKSIKLKPHNGRELTQLKYVEPIKEDKPEPKPRTKKITKHVAK
jgi:hypothetical protein